MASRAWRLDTDQWPGPNRRTWHITRDIVEPSPDGRFACVIYSINEVRLHLEGGLLALLGAPPEAPTLLFQPRNVLCFDFAPSPSAQWLSGSRYVAVTTFRYNGRSNRVDRLGFTFLDTATSTWAFVGASGVTGGLRFIEDGAEWIAATPPGAEPLRVSPATLPWTPWGS